MSSACWPRASSAPLVRDGQRLTNARQLLGLHPKVSPHSALLAMQQPRRGQHLEMVADRWLREAKRLDQLAGARLAAWPRGDQAEQPQPRRVGQHLQEIGQLTG